MADDEKNGTLSLIFGILGLVLPFIGFVFAILAIVYSRMQKKIKPTGTATAGLVLGIIGLVGHILLGALMMIGSLAYFGAVSPERMTPDRCTMNPPFSCMDYEVTRNEASISIMNNIGRDVTIQSVDLSCGTPSGAQSGTLANGASATYKWTDIADCISGDTLRGTITLNYLTDGDTTPRSVEGTLRSKLY